MKKLKYKKVIKMCMYLCVLVNEIPKMYMKIKSYALIKIIEHMNEFYIFYEKKNYLETFDAVSK